MTFLRQSVWAKGGDFTDPILLWYANGVGELKKRPIADKTSWGFMAAIHGIDLPLWEKDGYYASGDTLPSQTEQDTFWNQCQHASWYFLPWHRGYLVSLEAIVRDAIVKLGGPADWALPYWDYSDTNNTNARILPPAFSKTTLPDGSPNPLYVKQRYGAFATPPTLPLPPNDVVLGALQAPKFTGTPGGSPGFGGGKTGFSHSGGIGTGTLESKPHNIVHVDIGNVDSSSNYGLMIDPDLAGLDPIFYLHHCNIDRLWSVWLDLPGRANPTDPAWLNGPVSGRAFTMPAVDGRTWVFTPQNVVDTNNIAVNGNRQDYTYGASPSVAPLTLHIDAAIRNRIARLGVLSLGDTMVATSDEQPSAELIGANKTKIALRAATSTEVELDDGMKKRVITSFAALANTKPAKTEPDKIYLNLENIRADKEGIIIDVYLNLPEGADPAQHPELCVDSVGLFGIKKASRTDVPHGGAGITSVIDITDTVDVLHLTDQLAAISSLDITIVPRTTLPGNTEITIDRVSIYRESM